MILLSDLDKTLIFSYNHLSSDNLCVEKKDGKNLSYMTFDSAEKFRQITKKLTFIPITTRSIEQYNRIEFPFGFKPEYAVADNGATLLHNGIPDKKWRESYSEIFEQSTEILEKARAFLSDCPDVYFEIRIVDDSFLFTKCRNSDMWAERMNSSGEYQNCTVYTNGDKLYVMPDGINKGSALKKIRSMLSDTIIAAGDSLFDIPMLDCADISLVKGNEIDPTVLHSDIIISERLQCMNKGISENFGFVTDNVLELIGGKNI